MRAIVQRVDQASVDSTVDGVTTRVGEIGPGGNFGERALIKDELRSASIYCRTLCSFATLQKSDYNWIIGAAKKRELRAMCDFMRNFRIFRDLRNGSLEKIQYFMTKQTLKRGC